MAHAWGVYEEFGVTINMDNSAKASLGNFAPENVDVDWIISETDEYGS